MADTGFQDFTAFSDDAGVGQSTWSNPGNAVTSNNSYATVSVTAGRQSHYLKCQTPDGMFTIPVGATIDGIEARIERKTSASSAKDFRVQLVDEAGTIRTTDKADTSTLYTGSDVYATYGGATDLWGEAAGFWTRAKILDADFGLVFATQQAGTTGTHSVDHVQVKIYYTEAAAEGGHNLTLLGVGV